MKNQPFLLPLLGLIFGIFLVNYFPGLNAFFAPGILILAGFVFIFKKLQFLFPAAVFISFLVFGMGLAKIKESGQKSLETNFSGKNNIHLKIAESYKPSEKFYKYKARILSVDSSSVRTANCLLYWKKEFGNLLPDDEIWVNSKILPTQKALNPYQFDYADYLKRQGIQFTVFAGSNHFISQSGNSLRNRIEKYKREIYQKLLSDGYSKTSADLVGAMILGNQNEMDQTILSQYRKTGVVHILSISGLHVMMVFSVFLIVFYPLIYLPKGRILRIFVSLVFIWLYAVFVGLQPPVVRSGLMISIYYLTFVFSRKPNIYHTLALSAFILLLINPGFLFDVGFQLSYSAVFFIVWLMPVYARIFRPKNKFSKFIIGFIGTSISAQLGTFPITAHYFHQTSLLFLAGNVVMIIASYFMVIGGMFSIVISMAGVFPKFWVELFNFLISVCNDYIAWLSGFDSLIFDKISFRTSDSILLIISFFLLRFLILKFNLKYAVSFIALILIFESQRIYFHQKSISKKEFIVFHQRKNSVIGIRDGEKLDLFMGDLNDSVNFQNYILNAYEIHEEIEETRYFSLSDSVHSTYYKTSNFIWWENLKFLILNQDSGSKLPKTDYILVRENAKINLDSIENPVKIIADGSNYPNHLSEHENAVWRTKEKGAFRIIL